MALRMRGGRWAAVAVICAAIGCGGDDSLSRIEVQVEYPTEQAQNLTDSLHLWVLVADDSDTATCNALVARDVGPYSSVFERLADEVFLLPDEPSPIVEGVPRESALVYLEGVDFVGTAWLAACVALDISSSTETLGMALTSAGTFDCSDPATETGAPCDDGLYCTVGETCQGGACSGGAQRDCTGGADQCNSGSCDEALGCSTSPLPNGTPCNDNLFCTNGDVCADGACAGAARDCTAVEDQCNGSTCDETFGLCRQVPLTGIVCDDGLFCTDVDTCSSGTCFGAARDCTGVEDQCNGSTCDEGLDTCSPVPLSGTPCEDGDICTMDDACSAAGLCTPGPVTDADADGFPALGCGDGSPEDCRDDLPAVNPGATEGPLGDATCSDLLDNDCDTFVDDADTDSCS